ncbi:MAG: YceI family protein [Aquaticitalea sp.]
MKPHFFFLAAFLASIIIQAQSIFRTNEFQINTYKSELKWHGSSVFQFNDHDGNVQFKKGFIRVEKDQLWGGYFEVDMNSLVALDDGAQNELRRHLKSDDFFDVKRFPNAWLSIQKVTAQEGGGYEVEADLNIKGITKPVLFDAQLERVGTNWQLTSKFKIDRTRWNIVYGSKGNEVIDPIKNYSISDAIGFEVNIITQ